MTRDLASTAMADTNPDNRRALDIAASDALAAARKRRPSTRYSRFVSLMKLVLPILAGVLVMMVVLWPEFYDRPSKFQIGVAQIEIDGVDGQKLVNARYTGVDSANNPFSVTAETLAQNPEDEQTVDLKNPKADITVGAGSWLAVMAPNGQYRKKDQVLELFGGVNAFHDMGYEFRTEHAIVNFKDGSAFGESPVHGQGPFGELQSEGFRVFESGAIVIFTGRARLLLYPIKKGDVK